MYTVYKITNLINNKIYVGQIKNDFVDYYGSGRLIKKALEKYGIKNFKKDILKLSCRTQEECNKLETFWIQKLQAYDRDIGYNISKTNFGGDTFTHNPNKEQIRIKKSISSIGRKGNTEFRQSREAKEKISEAMKGENNPFYGKTHSEEWKQKHRNLILGTKQSKEQIQKRVEKNRGKKRNEEQRNRFSISRKGKIIINNGKNATFIYPNLLKEYEDLGYKKGKLKK